jgi:7-carboxy-7-deazaguanine synthase
VSRDRSGLTLPVNEIFPTIQGEGSFTGTPAWFVRVQGCPVGCGWCDTKHTWHVRDDELRSFTEVAAKAGQAEPTYSVAALEEIRAAMLKRPNVRHVVISGGEPCMYDLVPLTTRLLEDGFTVQVETSCTAHAQVHERTWITGSPKFDMPGGREVLTEMLARANEIKHPVGKQADIDRLVARVLPHIRPGVPVYLQPLSQSPKATALCVETALAMGVRVSVQTHKFIGVR